MWTTSFIAQMPVAGVGTGDLDLGRVLVVHRGRRRQRAGHRRHDRVAAYVDSAVGGQPRVVRERGREQLPVLRIHGPRVATPELFDGLDVGQALDLVLDGHRNYLRFTLAGLSCRRLTVDCHNVSMAR